MARPRISANAGILIGLGAGLALGIVAAATRSPVLAQSISIVEPLGTLWLNALRMTIVPLVVSLVVTGIAAASDAAGAGRAGGRTLLVIVLFLAGAGLFGAIAAPLLLELLPIDPQTAAAFTATLRGAEPVRPEVPAFGDWITGLIPPNAIAAAAEGAMLPLLVFSILLGLATTRLGAEPRAQLLGLFAAIRDAMMVIVQWVLLLAPVGVFALVLPLAASAGVRVVGALGHYVLLVSALCVIATLALYPVVVFFGGVRLSTFARAVARPQVVAFGTRSSLATLPAMLECAQGPLGVPPRIAALVLPLTVSLMRFTTPVKDLSAALFAASLAGVDLTAANVAAGAVVVVLMSLGGVGLPGQAVLVAQFTPVFLAVGAPLELLAPLLAVEVIPDSFGTVGNVTGDLAATVIVARDLPADDGVPAVDA
jgi:Na+/H+-dicarboxylate symporter